MRHPRFRPARQFLTVFRVLLSPVMRAAGYVLIQLKLRCLRTFCAS